MVHLALRKAWTEESSAEKSLSHLPAIESGKENKSMIFSSLILDKLCDAPSWTRWRSDRDFHSKLMIMESIDLHNLFTSWAVLCYVKSFRKERGTLIICFQEWTWSFLIFLRRDRKERDTIEDRERVESR